MSNVNDFGAMIREQLQHQIGVRLEILRDDHTVNQKKPTATRKDVRFTTAKGEMTLIMYADHKPYKYSHAQSFPTFGVSILSPRDAFVAEAKQTVLRDDAESLQRYATEIAESIVGQLESYLNLPEPISRWDQFRNWVRSWGNVGGKQRGFAPA